MMKLLRKLHLYTALVSGVFLCLICLSGASLIYAKELQQWIDPQHWLVSPADSYQSLALIVSQTETATNSQVKQIRLSENAQEPWQLLLSDSSWVNVNPYTARVMHRYQYESSLYGFLMAFHRWFLISFDDNSKPFKVIVSLTSLALVFEILLGFWLWLKPKRPLKRLKISKKAPLKTRWYQRHILWGVISGLPLILIAFSGMSFHWKQATQTIIEWATLSNTTQVIAPKIQSTSPSLPLDVLMTHLTKVQNGGRITRIYPPNSNGVFAVRLQLAGEHYGYSWRWLDASTGQLIAKHDAPTGTRADWVWNFRYVFHIGSFGGNCTKLLWLSLCLMPIFFLVTGLYFYFQRKRKK